LVNILRDHPAAQVVAVRLCRQQLDEQKFCQVIAWLSALTAALQRPATSSSCSSVPAVAHRTGHSPSNSPCLLQELLTGCAGLLEL